MNRRLLLPLALLLAAVCGPSVVPQSEIHTTRMLAVRADPPELLLLGDAGTVPPPVHFSSLAVTSDGGTPLVTFALCLSGDPFSPTFQCPGSDGIDLPDDTLDLNSPTFAPLLGALDGGFGCAQLPPNGLPQTEPGVVQVAVGFLATSGTGPGESERGVYRLGVRCAGRPNHNPELLAVTVPDGGSVEGATFPPEQEIQLTPRIPDSGPDSAWPSIGIDGGIETYSSFDGGVAYENLNYSWYASVPEMIYFRSREPTPPDSSETAYTRFKGHAAGSVTFYVVLRDGRGGTDWKVFDGAVLDAGTLP
jgi:hypothetical protein